MTTTETPFPLLDRLLAHDAWTTARALDLAQGLDDAQLDQPFDVGHGSLRETLAHMAGNLEVWADLMAGRPVRPMPPTPQTAPALRQRFEAAYTDFARLARAAARAGRLDDTYTDVLDQPPRQKSCGGTILHVITHNHQHRSEVFHMLKRLGAEAVPEGDVLSWEAAGAEGRTKV